LTRTQTPTQTRTRTRISTFTWALTPTRHWRGHEPDTDTDRDMETGMDNNKDYQIFRQGHGVQLRPALPFWVYSVIGETKPVLCYPQEGVTLNFQQLIRTNNLSLFWPLLDITINRLGNLFIIKVFLAPSATARNKKNNFVQIYHLRYIGSSYLLLFILIFSYFQFQDHI
jgi:hypothetical protein